MHTAVSKEEYMKKIGRKKRKENSDVTQPHEPGINKDAHIQ